MRHDRDDALADVGVGGDEALDDGGVVDAPHEHGLRTAAP